MTTSSAVTYEFRVEGHLDDHWSAWLGDLTITRRHDGTSTLTGPVADQAQLHGVLARLRDIGATLLSLNALEASPLPGQPRRVRLAWFFRTALSPGATTTPASPSADPAARLQEYRVRHLARGAGLPGRYLVNPDFMTEFGDR